MSSCVNSVSHFCGSWETVGLDGVLISIYTSGDDATSSSTFLSLSRLPCLLLCLLTLRDRRRETWLSPPHFSNARAISKRPVENCIIYYNFIRLQSDWNYGLLLEAIKSKVWRVSLNLPARSNDFLLGINEGSIPQLLWNLLICINKWVIFWLKM